MVKTFLLNLFFAIIFGALGGLLGFVIDNYLGVF